MSNIKKAIKRMVIWWKIKQIWADFEAINHEFDYHFEMARKCNEEVKNLDARLKELDKEFEEVMKE